MTKIVSINEHFEHFLSEMMESLWGDLEGKTRLAWEQFFEAESERMRARKRRYLPPAIEKFRRRAPELALLIREALYDHLHPPCGPCGGHADGQDGERASSGRVRVDPHEVAW